MRLSLMLLFYGLSESVLVKRNVVFQKVNEITTTRSRWLVTFVIDLNPYEQFLTKLENDFITVENSLENIEKMFGTTNSRGFLHPETFFIGALTNFRQELQSLKFLEVHLKNMFSTVKSLKVKNKRSILPFIGSALSFLFGTVSEQDLSSIRRNIKTLSKNQNKIAHVVKDSLTILNSTRTAVGENRKAINTLTDALQTLDDKRDGEKDALIKGITELASFVQAYAQMDRLMAALKDILHKAQLDMEHLQSQLNMLSLGHLSPITVTPDEFRRVLEEIQTHLPFYLKLPSNPETNLWDFYNILTCRTVLDKNHIYIVVSVPLLDENSKYEIYKIHNLPIPLNTSPKAQSLSMMAKYSLESSAIAINGDKSKYVLLNDYELQHCANPLQKFCKIESPIYPINLSELCVVALYLDNEDSINNFCKTVISPSSKKPLAHYLVNGIWIISATKSLQFTVVCQESNLRDSTVKVNPPLGIVKLPISCTASNNYLYLPAFYQNESKYEIYDPFDDITAVFNISKINLWEPLKSKLPNFNVTHLPKHLRSLENIPMDGLVKELDSLSAILPDDSENIPVWVWFSIGIGALILILVIFFWLKRVKQIKLFGLAREKSSIVRSVTLAGGVMPKDVGSGEGLEGRTTELPSAPLLVTDTNTSTNVEELKTMYPKLDLLTVKS